MRMGGRLLLICASLAAFHVAAYEDSAAADLIDDESTLLQLGVHTSKSVRTDPDPNAHLIHLLYGRNHDPNMVLCDDPRVHPLPLDDYKAYLAANDMTCDPVPETNTGPKITPDSPFDDIMTFMTKHEQLQRTMLDTILGVSSWLPEGPLVDNVNYEVLSFTAPAGHTITLYRSHPIGTTIDLPGVLHFHGGGMATLSAADKANKWWRRTIARQGLVVLGVEFRNSAGELGPHPFPAGLDDCVAALQYVSENKAALGINKVILAGEDGGGNLALATALRAKREGNAAQVDGVYVFAPFIADPSTRSAQGRFTTLFSLRENKDYVVSPNMLSLNSKVYDPNGDHSSNPLCWPLKVWESECAGLPPHVISVNEIDPLKDEGLDYSRRLARAGVNTYAKVIGGTWHGSDTWATSSDMYKTQSSAREIASFAKSV